MADVKESKTIKLRSTQANSTKTSMQIVKVQLHDHCRNSTFHAEPSDHVYADRIAVGSHDKTKATLLRFQFHSGFGVQGKDKESGCVLSSLLEVSVTCFSDLMFQQQIATPKPLIVQMSESYL